jgi:hypothetical protein
VVSAPCLIVMDPDGSDPRALPTPGVGETSLPDWTDRGRLPRGIMPAALFSTRRRGDGGRALSHCRFTTNGTPPLVAR